MKALSDQIARMEKLLANILMFAMAIVVALAVVFRYFMDAPLFWAGEVSIFLMVWITFLGGSLGLKYKSQAAVTIVTDHLPAHMKRLILIAGHALMLVFLALLTYYSFKWVLSPNVSIQKSSAMLLPMWIPYLSVPLGLSFASVHLLANMLDLIREDGVR